MQHLKNLFLEIQHYNYGCPDKVLDAFAGEIAKRAFSDLDSVTKKDEIEAILYNFHLPLTGDMYPNLADEITSYLTVEDDLLIELVNAYIRDGGKNPLTIYFNHNLIN